MLFSLGVLVALFRHGLTGDQGAKWSFGAVAVAAFVVALCTWKAVAKPVSI